MVKFGIEMPVRGVDYNTVKVVTLELERQGFDFAWFNDHMVTFGSPQTSYLECWTTMSALAAVTTKLRLGSYVLSNPFRYPSLTAKMVATLDVISQGRLDFGIGAGWFGPEFTTYGFDFPKPLVRIEQLEESLTLMKKLWTEEKATFQGKHYRIQDAYCVPKPVQKPHPPVWIGTLIGRKRMFKTIAEHADGWTLSSLYLPKPEDYKHEIEELQTHFRRAGRSIEKLMKAQGIGCIVARNDQELKEKIRKFPPLKLSFENYVTTQPRLEGTPDQCVKTIREYVDVGVTHFILTFPDDITLEPIRLFGEQVIPAFK